jgi:hypothetical protein
MISILIKFSFIMAFSILLVLRISAQEAFDQKHMEVSLRMIGHRVLLNAADSVSRVLPIINTNGQYRIEFESEFGFKPDDLVKAVSEIMEENKTAIRYIVEVEECESEQVVYSFEIDNLNHKDIIPCKPRGQSMECFSLVFTILEKQPIVDKSDEGENSNLTDLALPLSIGLIILFSVGLVIFYNKKKSPVMDGLIKLGKYQFDKRNALLILEEQKTELSSKEADLLQLLYSSANRPIKRETILNEIWEDEGNYVGRTLDVFISKLRAKLQADPTIKIVNIRGVGYKLVIND